MNQYVQNLKELVATNQKPLKELLEEVVADYEGQADEYTNKRMKELQSQLAEDHNNALRNLASGLIWEWEQQNSVLTYDERNKLVQMVVRRYR